MIFDILCFGSGGWLSESSVLDLGSGEHPLALDARQRVPTRVLWDARRENWRRPALSGFVRP